MVNPKIILGTELIRERNEVGTKIIEVPDYISIVASYSATIEDVVIDYGTEDAY